VPGVGDQGRGSDASPDGQLVPGDGLVAEDADGRAGDAPADIGGVPVLE
jgi:hypothetical protein